MVRVRIIDACMKPDNGNFDTPEMLELEREETDLEQKLLNTEVTSLHGAAAKVAAVDYDISKGLLWDEHYRLTADALRFMHEMIEDS